MKMIISNPHPVNTHRCDWSTLTSAEKRHGYLVTKCSACCFSKVHSLHFNNDILLVCELKINSEKLIWVNYYLGLSFLTKHRQLLLRSAHLCYLLVYIFIRPTYSIWLLNRASSCKTFNKRRKLRSRIKPKPCARGMCKTYVLQSFVSV